MADRIGLAERIEAMVGKSPGADAMATYLSREQWRLVIAALRANTDPSLSRHHELQNPAGGTIPSDQGNAGGAGPLTGDPPVGSAPQPCADPSLERVEAMREDKLHPSWSTLAKMKIALANRRGIRLSPKELERLQTSPVGQLMDAARAYGASTSNEAVPDPILLPGAVVRAGPALPVPNEGAERC